jgi:hypothetical protein
MEEMGLMRTWTGWLALLLTAGVVLAPTRVYGQDLGLEDPVLPLPLGHDRMEKGGFYTAGEFVMFRQDNPLKHQIIAVRGILDFDGSITADLTGTPVVRPGDTTVIIPGTPVPGNFLGSRATALAADDVSGPLSYQPGFRLTAGWKFRDGTAVEFSWMTLTEAKYNAVATLVPPTLNPGALLTETFLFAPVYNYPNDFAGPPLKIALGNPFAAYGVWNGATIMSLSFVQRFSQYDLSGRFPIFETDYCRCYGRVGPRYVNMWERFSWRTVGEDFAGQAGPDDVAIYSNVVSNQMYGINVGLGTEWYIGKGFSVSLDGNTAGLVDIVHEIAKYERGDLVIGNKRAKRDYNVVPELSASINVWWYPFEGVQIRAGYEIMSFFNTLSAPDPVSFNYGGLDVNYKSTTRFFDGFNFGIGFIF